MYGTQALRPFSRTMTEDEAKRIDPMGRIPGILAPNGMFSQICKCAERLGIRLKLKHDVPALANLSMHPNERTCKSCLRRGCSNWRESNPCWEGDRCGGCFGGYVWDRRSASRRGRGGIPGCHGQGGSRSWTRAPRRHGQMPAGDGRGSAWSS